MQLKVWSPILDLEKEFRSLMERFTEGEAFAFRPTTDMVKEDEYLKVTMELPGIDIDDDVEISVLEDILTIKGEKSIEEEITEEDHYIRERHYGRFERRIPLPDGVDAESVTATYDKGVLTVLVPLPVETVTEPKKIEVKTE